LAFSFQKLGQAQKGFGPLAVGLECDSACGWAASVPTWLEQKKGSVRVAGDAPLTLRSGAFAATKCAVHTLHDKK
jgi:hypothetical protein